MPDRALDSLREQLLASGVAPKYVARALSEIQDHLEDATQDVIERGSSEEDAVTEARQRLGSTDSIVRLYSAQRELTSWTYRHPRLAVLVLPAASPLLMPAVSDDAGARCVSFIGKWCVCLLAGGCVTTGLLWLMQLGITLG